jgi:hypothetical protein
LRVAAPRQRERWQWSGGASVSPDSGFDIPRPADYGQDNHLLTVKDH